MSPIRTTKHTVYDLKYHFVWIPKYRKQVLKGDVKEFTEEVFRRIVTEYGWEIEEMAIEDDHVHLFLLVPPKYAPAKVAQIMKSISAREIFKEFPRLRKQLWAGEFWADGYFVRSVGDNVTSEIIKRYIRYQDDSDKPHQLKLWD
jgi:putative transposase